MKKDPFVDMMLEAQWQNAKKNRLIIFYGTSIIVIFYQFATNLEHLIS